jgi:hypothetical protein
VARACRAGYWSDAATRHATGGQAFMPSRFRKFRLEPGHVIPASAGYQEPLPRACGYPLSEISKPCSG